MVEPASLFPHHLGVRPEDDLEALLKQAPARPAVYLLVDQEERPLQLLSVRNLRASIQRRLGSTQEEQISRRINYRDLVRGVHYLRVDGHFEADFVYLRIARELFAQSYQSLFTQRQPWFIHVDPLAQFPRFVKTNAPMTHRSGMLLGPIEDKHAANRLIELLESAFDLCRYYTTLTQAPHGKACAYKEMGRCDAPCDGSARMEVYRQRIAQAAQTATNPAPERSRQEQNMQLAARELKFEQAGRIKTLLGQLSQLGTGPFKAVRFFHDWRFLAIGPGPKAGSAKLFLVTPGQIEPLASLPGPSKELAELIELAQARARQAPSASAEEITITATHLLRTPHLFLPLDGLSERALDKSIQSLRKQTSAEESPDEGVLTELEAL